LTSRDGEPFRSPKRSAGRVLHIPGDRQTLNFAMLVRQNRDQTKHPAKWCKKEETGEKTNEFK
jgi:hypothetical protein